MKKETRMSTTSASGSSATGKVPILGRGRHTYEWIDHWARLPEGKRFGYTHGVRVDRRGRIIIFNQSPDAVCLFEPDGTFVKSWGAEFAKGAHGLTLSDEDGSEFLYLADYERHEVVKATLEGEIVYRLGVPPRPDLYPDPAEYKPTNTAVGPNGEVYVVDGYGNHYVHQYSRDAEYVRSWGGLGEEPGKLKCPHGIALDTRTKEPLLIVADRGHNRLQYFTLEGEHAGFVTGDLWHPCHFHIRGDELLIPELYGRVVVLDQENKPVAQLGAQAGVNKREGWPNLPHDQRIPGLFNSPHDACWDAAGNIFVVEWIEDGRVTKLRRVDDTE
jgi:hypothetical protein